MTTTQLATISKLNQQLGPTFRAAAPASLNWASEKTFFEAQVRKHWQIERAVQSSVPDTVESLKLAVRECASMGLSMSPTASLVYFIPRRQRKMYDNESKADYERKVPWLVTATPSYRGLAFISTHYAGAELLASEVVYAEDEFVFHGPIQAPEHKPTLRNDHRIERNAIGAYAAAILDSGRVRAEYVDAPTIQKIRSLSEFPGGLMWTKLWTEGWRKVPIRRLCKLLMVGEPRMQAAVEAMNRNEGIVIEGEAANVPRETSDAPRLERGMNGLGAALNTSKARQQAAAEPQELEPVTIDQEPEQSYIANPAPSKHPPGSIEWFADQIKASRTFVDLDAVKAGALLARLDQSDDADIFRSLYAAQHKAIKEGVNP